MFKKVALSLSLIFLLSFLSFSSSCKRQENNITSYTIDLSIEENLVSGFQVVEYFNDSETAIKELKFNLFANAFRKDAKFSPISDAHKSQSYPNGINYGDMQIKSVSSCGEKIDFIIAGEDENILIVRLKKEVFPEEKVKVEIQFLLTLANVVSRTGINDNTINLGNFYPILCARNYDGFYECVYYSNGDPFYSDCADYEVSITLNSDFVIASSGKLVEEKVNGNKKTAKYKIKSARSFCFVLSKDFCLIEDDVGDVKIKYYYYDDLNYQKSLEYAKKSIKLFGELFGEYVYDEYSVVQTEFVQGGMEFPALTMISDDLSDASYGEVIVHETAHQWWQTAVGNNEVEYAFLDEGLTEYSVVIFYENHPEYGLSRQNLVKSAEDTYRIFCSVSDKVFGKVDTSMIKNLKDFNGEYEYVNLCYIKPCIMYDYLRKTIGEKRFFKGLKTYYENYKYKNATPDDLVGTFEKIGADTNGFFQSFFDGKVII